MMLVTSSIIVGNVGLICGQVYNVFIFEDGAATSFGRRWSGSVGHSLRMPNSCVMGRHQPLRRKNLGGHWVSRGP